MGLAFSVPALMKARGGTYADQATYSLAQWPYSLKLFWAPVVDALWTRRAFLGPRKCWVVGVQLLAGSVMMGVSTRLGELLGGNGVPINVEGLTATFFVLYLLVATQDIAVDAWALTMLRPENVGYASTANNVGQMAGVLISYSGFVSLESAAFCNSYVRPALSLPSAPTGMVTMASFMWFWGAAFVVVTLLLWALKEDTTDMATSASDGGHIHVDSQLVVVPGGIELVGGGDVEVAPIAQPSSPSSAGSGSSARRRRAGGGSRASSGSGGSSGGSGGSVAGADTDAGEDAETAPLTSATPATAPAQAAPVSPWRAVAAAYAALWRILQLHHVRVLLAILATYRFCFMATDHASGLALLSRGLTREQLAQQDMWSTPILLFGQVLVARAVAGPRPLSIIMASYPVRLAMGLGWLAITYLALPAPVPGQPLPALSTAALAGIFLMTNAHGLIISLTMMSQTSFFTQVADPAAGGTYMTLLNTVSNFGGKWAEYVNLRAMHAATVEACVAKDNVTAVLDGVQCGSGGSAACTAAGGACTTLRDGYPIMVWVGTAVGVAWFLAFRRTMLALQDVPRSQWALPSKH